MSRLNATDEMLARTSETLGSTRVVQVLWTVPNRVETPDLNEFWERIDASRLSRRARKGAVPLALREWARAANAEPPTITEAACNQDDDGCWVDEQVRRPLVERRQELWRLSALNTRRGTLVSLVVPHFRSDGLGVFAALAAGACQRQSRAWWVRDLANAGHQLGWIAVGVVSWAAETLRARVVSRSLGVSTPSVAAMAERDTLPEPSTPRFFATAWVRLDAEEWHCRARELGTTSNGLFTEVAANIVRSRPSPAQEVIVGIPVSRRGNERDQRANALIVVPLSRPRGNPDYTSLATTRARLKETVEHSRHLRPTVPPESLWHLLPAGLAGRMVAGGAQQTDVVASNFGRVDEFAVPVCGQTPDGVGVRSMNVPGVVPGRARLRASLCLIETAGSLTLCLTAIPDLFGDEADLHALAVAELSQWGVHPMRWV